MYGISRKIHERFINRKSKKHDEKYTVSFPTDIPNPNIMHESGLRSVLKYPESKWNIDSQLVRLIPEHHTYVEPFFGSGAVLFNKQLSDIETVNNLDSNVVNLFHCIQEASQNLARMVMSTPFGQKA